MSLAPVLRADAPQMVARAPFPTSLSTRQRKGVLLTTGGAVATLSFPLSRLLSLGLSDWAFTFFLTMVGACALVWGLLVLRTGRWRPLTPPRALWVPVATLLPFAAGMLFTEPPSFTLYDPLHATVPGALGVVFESPMEHFVVAATFAVLGSALRRSDRLWLVAGGLLSAVSAVGIRTDFAESPNHTSVPGVLLATTFGIVVMTFAYRASAPRDE